jgi:signal transduction histidine kinase
MKSSKQFMAWGIDLKQWTKGKRFQSMQPAQGMFQSLSLKLLLSYVGAMMVVMGLSAGAVYQYFANGLFQEVDVHLVAIAEAAKHNFSAILHNPTAAAHKLPAVIDQDADLDLPWQDLQNTGEMVEWFDAEGNRLSVAGHKFPLQAFKKTFQSIQQGKIRALTLPIAAKNQPPQGYVRVTMGTQEVDEDLHRLLVGLGIGGIVAITLISLTGGWLTRRSLRPIERGMEKLQQFTADASHEMRSPITAIKIAVDVMQSHPERIHAADVRKLRVIAQATQHMTHLMEDLLLLARADYEAIERLEELNAVPLHELLEDLVELLQPKLETAGLILKFESFKQIWVEGSSTQLGRVFLNLLENAIAYTPKGGRIDVTLSQLNAIALVNIRDTGIGIDASHLPYIFDRFWRADRSRSRRTGGVGLGLAIAQTIIQAHRGRITVTSQLDSGSCFQVELPKID